MWDRVYNPLATLAALPDDTPEVTPDGSPRDGDSSDDDDAVPAPKARVAARPPAPLSARELLQRHSLRGSEEQRFASATPSPPPPLPSVVPPARPATAPEHIGEHEESVPPPRPMPLLALGKSPAVAPPPPLKKKIKKKAKKRPGKAVRDALPIRAPPPPPGVKPAATAAAAAAPGESTSEARATASKFVAAARPEVQDGKDCVIVGTSLKGGTVQKVLEWLVFFEPNDASVQDFVLCFDAFVPLWKVALVLRQMHDHYESPADQTRVRRFAARLFEERCRDDPGMEGAAELLSLMQEALAAAPTPRHLGLIKIVRARRAAESSLVPQLLSQFLEFSPKALAEALTRYQHEVFRSIQMEELISWPLPTRGMAGYLANTDRELHNWAVMAVALAPQPQLAARRMLQVLEKLLAMNNYNSLMCLVSGLSRVVQLLGPKQKERLTTLAALVNPANNYRVFRDHVAAKTTVRSTVFPIFDAHVGMLEFIHNEQAAYLGPSYINFRKVKLLGALFAEIKGYQRMHYDVPENMRVFGYVLALGQSQPPPGVSLPLRPCAPPTQLSRLSLQIEEEYTANPLRSLGSQQAIKNLVSPRIVPASAMHNLGTEEHGDKSEETREVANAIYNPVAAKLPYRLQRESILRAYARFVKRVGDGPLPEAIQQAIHEPRGARGPRVGESALFEHDDDGVNDPPPDPVIVQPLKLPAQQQQQQQPAVLTRGNSLGAGLSRVKEYLSPRGGKDKAASQKPSEVRPSTASPPSAPSLHGSSDAITDSTSLSTGRQHAEMDVEGVAAWLATLSLEEHQAAFRDNQINGTALLLLNEDDLRGMQVDKVGHRKQMLRAIGELRAQAGMPALALSPREMGTTAAESEVVVVSSDGTLHRRIAKKQEQDQELYVKGVFKGTVRLMRLDAAAADVAQLYAKFKEEFGKPGCILYKDAEGDSISIDKPSDLEYAIQDSALRGGIVKLTYAEV